MESGSETRRGLSKKGEDRVVAMPDLGLFAVFDGHAGSEASDFAARELPEKLRKLQKQQDQDSRTAEERAKELLASAIAATDSDFLAQAEACGIRAGSTACVAMATQELVVVANVGDSRAIAFQPMDEGDGGLEAVALSQDHKPKIPSERARIEAAGGKVVHDGVSLRLEGGLGLTRALGDKYFKKFQGLSAEPEFRVWAPPRSRRPCFLVLASDGAFEKLSIKAVGGIIDESKHESAQSIAAKIVERGVRVDDISVVVVKWHSV